MNQKNTKIYFSPSIVEPFGGKSNSYLNTIKESNDYWRKVETMLLCTESLHNPHFIVSYCNVDFPNSVVIDCSGNVFKCWASIEDQSKNIGNLHSINELFLDLKYIPFVPSTAFCKYCNVFPACLGGCKFQEHDEQYCTRKRERIIQNMKLTVLKDML